MSPKTLYQILQVDPQASTEVIEAAYHRLAKIYHPDVNKSTDALRIMQELNDAYKILNDPHKRSEYDKSLQEQNNIPPSNMPNGNSAQVGSVTFSKSQYKPETRTKNTTSEFPASCEKCGRSDATLRLCYFPYVISVLILTFRRSWGGLYCTKCRHIEMLKAKLTTLLLGWWGIPFGPIFSLGVLFSPSEGKIPPEDNAKYLAALSGYFIMKGEMAYAQEAMELSLGYKPDQELTKIYHDIFGRGKHTFKQPGHGSISGVLFGLGSLIGLSIVLCLFGGFSHSLVASEIPTSTPSCINWSSISSSDLGVSKFKNIIK